MNLRSTNAIRSRGGRLELNVEAGAADERALVKRAQGGERDAFEQLVRVHAAGLHAVVARFCVSREEAEEVTQETFLRAWRAIGGFQGDAQLFTWLYRIAVNEAKRRIERRAVEDAGSLEEQPARELADGRATPDVRAEQADVRATLEAAVRALDLDYRAPLILRDIEGLPTIQAAQLLGLSEAAFKSRLHRARVAVREVMAQHLGDPAC